MTAFRNVKDLVKIMSNETLELAKRDYPQIFVAEKQSYKSPRPAEHESAWPSEDAFMKECFKHLKIMEREFPELSMAYHVPNENAHKRPGVRGGVLDVYIPVPRGVYNQLAIELKLADGRLTSMQIKTIAELESVGSKVHVIWDSLDEFIHAVREYMSLATKNS